MHLPTKTALDLHGHLLYMLTFPQLTLTLEQTKRKTILVTHAELKIKTNKQQPKKKNRVSSEETFRTTKTGKLN